MNSIEIRNLHKSYNYPKKVAVFENFSLKINEKITAFFGPNGCGKTTLLKLISNLIKADKGSIKINSNKIKIGYVFQTPSNFIFPWMTNYENIAFPLRLEGLENEEIEEKIIGLIKSFNLRLPLDVYPYQISGGQQQMVVILRALINEPNILLLDEPFSSLDYLTKLRFLSKLSQILRKKGMLTIFISHTIEEAILIADEVILLSEKPAKILGTFKTKFKKHNLEIIHSEEFLNLKEKILGFYK